MNASNVSELPLRKNWKFQLLWIAAGFSNLGQATVSLALPILILVATGSPALAGLAATVSLASGLLVGFPAGVWVDRLDRRKILLFSQAAQPLIWGAFAALVYLDVITVWSVILASALSGGAAAFTLPAHASALQALVPKQQLATAHAQGQARVYAVQLGGPPLGGLLYSIGRVSPFVFHAVATTVSVLCYLAAGVPRRPVGEAAKGPNQQAGRKSGAARVASMKDDFVAGFRWLIGQRGLRAVLGIAIFLNPLVNAIWIPIIVLVNERGGGALDTGIIMASVGIGGLLGALLSTRLSKLLPAGKLVLLVGFVIGLSYCLIPLPLGMHWPMVPLIIACLASPSLNVAIMALVGREVPSSMMGRMSSMLTLSFQGLAPLGPAIGGLLAAALGGGEALVVCGASLLAVVAVAATGSAMGGLSTEADAPPGPAEPTPDEPKARPQLEAGTIRHLQQIGVIAVANANVTAIQESLTVEEVEFLVSLSTRIKATSPDVPDPEVVAHSEASAMNADTTRADAPSFGEDSDNERSR